MLFIALVILLVVGIVWHAHRNGHSFDGVAWRALALLAAIFGLALATFLARHAAATASDDVHRAGDVTWIVILAVVAGVAGMAILVGTLLWYGGSAWSLRLAGFIGLLLTTLGSMSFVLPFFAPLALLAVPSLAADGRRQATTPARP